MYKCCSRCSLTLAEVSCRRKTMVETFGGYLEELPERIYFPSGWIFGYFFFLLFRSGNKCNNSSDKLILLLKQKGDNLSIIRPACSFTEDNMTAKVAPHGHTAAEDHSKTCKNQSLTHQNTVTQLYKYQWPFVKLQFLESCYNMWSGRNPPPKTK